MSKWKEITHFLYGKGFWYADPLREIQDLTEEQLFWIPGSKSLPIIWHVGHIAHRERFHIGRFLQNLEGTIIPPQYEVFGPDWRSSEDIRKPIGSIQNVFNWMCDVRDESHKYIASLNEDDFHTIPTTSEDGLSIAHWLFITTAHTALHIGRIQLLRSLIEGDKERAC